MRLAFGFLAGSTMIVALSILAGPASAYDRDRIYSDDYGNLIIESASGYKRILVGEGGQAGRLAAEMGSGEPGVVYADEGDRVASTRECYRPPVLVKGRSYMYGFDEGEIPLQGGPCR